MHFCYLSFFYFRKVENTVETVKRYVTFIEMVPLLRVLTLIGSLGSEVEIVDRERSSSHTMICKPKL